MDDEYDLDDLNVDDDFDEDDAYPYAGEWELIDAD